MYKFTFPQGEVIFDFENSTIELHGKAGRKKDGEVFEPIEGAYSLEEIPLFTGFYLTGLTILEGIDMKVKGKMYIGSEGFLLEFFKLDSPVDGKVGFLLAQDLKNKRATKFSFNRANLYAFLKMLEEREKIVPVENTVWEKREGKVFVNRVEVPFQKAKALRYALKEILRKKEIPRLVQEWEEGRLTLHKNKLEVQVNGKTLGRINLSDVGNISRLLVCL
ncbi:hypothetical protein [Aquifex sp.]